MNDGPESSTAPETVRNQADSRVETARRLPVVLQVLPSLDVGGGGGERSAIDIA
ncbi:MAG: hypothetical protein VW881_07495 [Alphaproteobacteria bacterium]